MEITAKLWNFELNLPDRKRHNHFPSYYYSFWVKNLSCVNSWLLFTAVDGHNQTEKHVVPEIQYGEEMA